MKTIFKLSIVLTFLSLLLWSCEKETKIDTPAELHFNVKQITFADVELTKKDSYKLIISNKGEQELVINKLSITGKDADDFYYTGEEKGIGYQKSDTLQIYFAPKSVGEKKATLQVQTSIGAYTMSLSGTGVPLRVAKCKVTPIIHNFDKVYIAEKKLITITVENQGDAVLKVNEISLIGKNANQFALTGTESIESILVKKKEMFTVEFAPTDKNLTTASATVLLKTNVGEYKVTLEGTVAVPQPEIVISPESYDFAAVTIGKTKSKQFIVGNEGKADLIISKVAITGTDAGEFLLDGQKATIPVGGTQNYTVTYKPTSMNKTTVTAYLELQTQLGTTKIALTGMPLPAPTPIFSITPKNHDFGGLEIGKTATKDFIVTNKGKADLVISAYKLNEGTSGQFSVTDCKGTIAPNGTKKITVTFHPTTEPTATATLELTTNAGKQSVGISGMPLPKPVPIFSATPKDHTFNATFVGKEESKTITVENTGNATLTISNISLVGTNSAQFRIENPGSLTSIPAGGSSKLVVVFAPNDASLGGADAKIKFVTNAGEHLVNLSGKILVPTPIFSITPKYYDFGGLEIGKTATKDFVVTNKGKADLVISAYKLNEGTSGQFSVTDCKGTIAPNGTKKITVTFHPTTEPTATATLELTTNAGKQSVGISGMPLPKPKPVFVASPSDHTFSATYVGEEDNQTITVENTGNATLTISNISLMGTNSKQFRIENPGSLTSISAGGSSKLVVVFAPNDASLGGADAKIKFVTNAGEHFVNLSGKILVPTPIFSIIPKDYDFGGLEIGKTATKDFIVTNKGKADLVISAYELNEDIPGQFSVTNCKGTIAPNGTKKITVTFHPTTEPTATATLELTTNAGKQSVGISGMPLPKPVPIFSATPKDHTFNATFVGKEESKTITIENKGNAPMTISNISLEGTNSKQFRLENPGSLTSIPAGGSSKLVVVFAPNDASLGGADAKIKFVTNAGEHFVNLSGKILTKPELEVTPEEYDFGTVKVGKSKTTTIRLRSIGTAPVSVSSIELVDGTDVFTITKPALPLVLQPGKYKDLALTFTPKDGTKKYTTIAIGSNGGDAKINILGIGKEVETSTRIRFSNTEMTEAELRSGIVKSGIKLVSAEGVLAEGVSAGEYVLHMWPATLDMDLTAKPVLKGIKAFISTNGAPFEFILLDKDKKKLHTQSFEIPPANGTVGQKEVEITYSNMAAVKYVQARCLEGFIKYIIFEY